MRKVATTSGKAELPAATFQRLEAIDLMRHVWSAIVYVSLVPHGRACPPQSSTPLYWQYPHAHAPHITPGKSLNGLTSTFGFTRPVLASSTASKHSLRLPTTLPCIFKPLTTISARVVSICPPPRGMPIKYAVPPRRSIQHAWEKAECAAATMTECAPPAVSFCTSETTSFTSRKSMKVLPKDSTSLRF